MVKCKMQEKRKRYHKYSTPSDDIITLINLVRQNPALYNYKLQPDQRRRSDILLGWGQIAARMGNRYTIEECRRKWKNLRDTYHQYRLRKPKVEDSLSKWRYAKELYFLSNIYQPKMKANRNLNYNADLQIQEIKSNCDVEQDDNKMDDATITLVNEETETFILTSYDESVGDHTTHDDEGISHMELTHGDDVEEEIVKDEHNSFDDGVENDTVVDYEEVCLYEEAGNSSPDDCETIIGGPGTVTRNSSTDTKPFQYIDANDFCIGEIETTANDLTNSTVIGTANIKTLRIPTSAITCSGISTTATVLGTTKKKTITIPTNSISCTDISTSTNALVDTVPGTYTISTPIVQLPLHHQQQTTPTTGSIVSTNTVVSNGNLIQTQSLPLIEGTIQTRTQTNVQTQTQSYVTDVLQSNRDELDLFFDFLKKKIQNFSKEEITSIQIEFLNCIVQRENNKK